MGLRKVVATALAVLGVLAAPAGAATIRTVDKAAGPYTTITDALHAAAPGDTIDIHEAHYDEQLWVDKDDITLRGAPGTIVSSTSPYAVSLMGERDTIDGLWVGGGPGGVRVEGDDATIVHAKITADKTALFLNGAVDTTVELSELRAADLDGVAVSARNDDAAPRHQTTVVRTAIVVGGREGTAFDVRAGRAGDLSARGDAAVTLVYATVAGAPAAFATGSDGKGGPVTVEAYNSIVHGTAPALTPYRTEHTASDAATFAQAPADFHLRADAPAVGYVDTARPAGLPTMPLTDFAGIARGGLFTTNSVGAYEFVNRPPTAVFMPSGTVVRQGEMVTFDASASADPDLGGRIAGYHWTWGDTAPGDTTTPVATHAFGRVGTYTMWLRTTDNNGEATDSRRMAITVTDAVAPKLTVTAPRDKARLHRYRTIKATKKRKRHRVVNVLRFGGRASDAGGVARVEVELRQTKPKTKRGLCTFLDAARLRVTAHACADPPVMRAALKGGAWSWATPSKLAIPVGSWELTVRATDPAGNLTTSVLHFTVT